MSRASEAVRVTVRVGLTPDEAFTLFTEDVDSWWQRKPSDALGPTSGGTLRFVDGALRQAFDNGEDKVVADVRVWEVGRRLHLDLHDREGDGATQVEVSFAPAGDTTEVVLEHRGCARLAPRNPARRGLRGRAFADMLGLRWADRLARLQRAAKPAPRRS